ncbi:hypothetical protein [Rickettsia montanensis]|nr:hypothetical protein [Rickettsia montanensis]
MKGYDSIKCNVVFGSAISNIQLGNLEEAEKKYPNDGIYVQSKSSRSN